MKRLKKRTAVVGVFPNRASCDRLIGAQLLEVHESWMADRNTIIPHGADGSDNPFPRCRRIRATPLGRQAELPRSEREGEITGRIVALLVNRVRACQNHFARRFENHFLACQKPFRGGAKSFRRRAKNLFARATNDFARAKNHFARVWNGFTCTRNHSGCASPFTESGKSALVLPRSCASTA